MNKTQNLIVIDAGWKSMTMDSGCPAFKDLPNDGSYKFTWGGDEHSMIGSSDLQKFPFDLSKYKLDDKIWLIPGHCDPTVNLHDFVYGVRDGVVEKVFKIDGRGPGL